MNFFRFPVLFVSGAFMPLAEMPSWIKPMVFVSPLTYVVELLRLGAVGHCSFVRPWFLWTATAGFVVLSWLVARLVFRRYANR